MTASDEIITTRRFSVSRERLFSAIADPDLLAKWWGPAGFTNTIDVFEFHPGGKWNYVMHGPDGTDYPNVSMFSEIMENERLVLNHLEPGHRFTIVMTLADDAGGARLTWSMRFDDPEELEKVGEFVRVANEQNFDRLENVLLN